MMELAEWTDTFAIKRQAKKGVIPDRSWLDLAIEEPSINHTSDAEAIVDGTPLQSFVEEKRTFSRALRTLQDIPPLNPATLF